ncbi:hypothetical protein YC2023_090286 [Brassica napus]
MIASGQMIFLIQFKLLLDISELSWLLHWFGLLSHVSVHASESGVSSRHPFDSAVSGGFSIGGLIKAYLHRLSKVLILSPHAICSISILDLFYLFMMF